MLRTCVENILNLACAAQQQQQVPSITKSDLDGQRNKNSKRTNDKVTISISTYVNINYSCVRLSARLKNCLTFAQTIAQAIS